VRLSHLTDGDNQVLIQDRWIESIKAIFSVPFPRDKQFVDRKSVFSEIDIGFREGRPVALCGMGGNGYGISAIQL